MNSTVDYRAGRPRHGFVTTYCTTTRVAATKSNRQRKREKKREARIRVEINAIRVLNSVYYYGFGEFCTSSLARPPSGSIPPLLLVVVAEMRVGRFSFGGRVLATGIGKE